MAKRRTRKDKISARHTYEIKWDPEAKNRSSEAGVNRQKITAVSGTNESRTKFKNADILAKDEFLTKTKRDMIKSILLALAIIGLEVMIYLSWQA